jgi:outer membrane immunogenic protein
MRASNLPNLLTIEDAISADAKPTALIGRFGFFVADQVAIEGRLGFGLSSDTVRVWDWGWYLDVEVELDRLYGIYAIGHIPIGKSASLYELVGFTDAKATFKANGFSFSETDSGFPMILALSSTPHHSRSN